MEYVIDRLLRAFETGKMTRRQLIKSLTIAATAASHVTSTFAQTTAIPAARGPAPWKTVWLDHISYGVSDYRKSAAFYRDLMGWEVKTDNRRNQCSMTIGNVGGIIIRNSQRAPGVIDHVSWGIEPWATDTVKAELDRRGLKPRADMIGERFKSFHVQDPDGRDLQISNQRDAKEL